ncbi:HlyD family efflux transporter periplasmic adaptor subunit [Pleurocapsales cyanobacterium LEGE 10410]|nr:HlyD family efflux transporter periplasmic adaptor subunit [Pleurocapsales cyanobacterium LEGE 10410]
MKQGQLSRIQQGEAKQGEIAAQLAVITEIEARLATETRQKEAQISQAEATLRNAQGKYQRYTPLAQEGAIGVSLLNDVQEELEKAKGALVQLEAELEHTESTLQAKLAQEKANLAQLQEVRPIDVAIAQAELKQAQIQVEQYKAELDNTNVRVPVAGQILRINTRVGEQVNVQQGIAELGQTKQIYAIAEIQETDITKISLGQPATIKSEYGGFEGAIKGTVAKIGLQIGKSRIDEDRQNPDNPANDLNERVVEVKIRLNPEDSSTVAAFTGMQVKVNSLQRSSDCIPLSLSAISWACPVFWTA